MAIHTLAGDDLPEDGSWDHPWDRRTWDEVWNEMDEPSGIHHAPERRGMRRAMRYRAPSPGLAAVLSVLPGLGHVYSGRLAAGVVWFLATNFAYWAVLVPGFLVHAVCFWSAYRSAREWNGY